MSAVRTFQTTPRYERAYKRYVGRDRQRRQCIADTLATLLENPWHPSLGTHRLKGSLEGALSCSCGYDCRILFTIEPSPRPHAGLIVLHDVGTHDEVY